MADVRRPSHSAGYLSAKKQQRYELWKGRNVFLMKGKFMFGSDFKHLIATILLLLIPMIMTFAFVSPHFRAPATVYIVVLFVLVVVFLFLTALTEPGLIPRNHPDLEVDPPPNHDSDVPTLNYTYCETCNLFRPPRAKHCSFCDNCVELFDHHCPWTGNCVGRRNYRFYLIFVTLVNLLSGSLVGMALWEYIDYMKSHPEFLNLFEVMGAHPWQTGLLVYGAAVWICVAGLLSFHIVLVSKGETTNEKLRGVFSQDENLFTRGLLGNLKFIFCARVPRSRVDNLHEWVVAGPDGFPLEDRVAPPSVHLPPTCQPLPPEFNVALADSSIDESSSDFAEVQPASVRSRLIGESKA